MKKVYGFMAVLVLLAVLAGTVMAVTLTFADSTLSGQHEILLINSSGGIFWQGNSSTTVDAEIPNETVIIHIKPEAKNILETPETLLDEIGYQIRANLIVLLFVGIMAIVLFGRRT